MNDDVYLCDAWNISLSGFMWSVLDLLRIHLQRQQVSVTATSDVHL